MTYEEARQDIIESGINLGAGDYVDVEALAVAVEALEKVIELQKQKKKTYKQIKTVLYHTSKQEYFDREANEALKEGWTLTKRTAMQKGDGDGTILIAELEKEVEIDD